MCNAIENTVSKGDNNSNKFSSIISPMTSPTSSSTSSSAVYGNNKNDCQKSSLSSSSSSSSSSTMMKSISTIKDYLWSDPTFYGLDVRSLSVSRILVSYLILRDVCHDRLHLFSWRENKTVISELEFFYSEDGALPQSMIRDREHDEKWSIFFASSSLVWSKICFAVLICSAVVYGIGYRTKLFNFIVWFMYTGLQSRTTMLNQGGDLVFKTLLFWSLFLPMGEVLSLDSYLEKHLGSFQWSKQKQKQTELPPTSKRKQRKTKSKNALICGLGSFCFVLQISLVYFMSALYKDHPIWHNGEAVHYVMQISKFLRTPKLAQFVVEHKILWKSFTLITYYWELYGPIWIMVTCSCQRMDFWRTIGAMVFIKMHVGFHLFMYLGEFPHICGTYWIAILPGSFWEMNCIGWTLFDDSDDENNDVDDDESQHRGDCEKEEVCSNGNAILQNGNSCDESPSSSSSPRPSFIDEKEEETMMVMKTNYGSELRRRRNITENTTVSNGDGIGSCASQNNGKNSMDDAVKSFLSSDKKRKKMPQSKSTSSSSSSSSLPRWLDVLCSLYDLLFNKLGRMFVLHCLPLWLMCCVVIPWNLIDLPYAKEFIEEHPVLRLNEWQRTIMRVTDLEQRWNMFSPYPDTDDGWFLLLGQFIRDEENTSPDDVDDWNVTQCDLWNGRHGFLDCEFPVVWATEDEMQTWNVTFQTQYPNATIDEESGFEDEVTKRVFMLSRKKYYDKSNKVSQITRNHRWDKYGDNLWHQLNIGMRQPFAEAVCRNYNSKTIRWNERNVPLGKKARKLLSTFHYVFMRQRIQHGPYTPKHEVEPFVLWHHYCFDDYYDLLEPRINQTYIDHHNKFIRYQREKAAALLEEEYYDEEYYDENESY